MANAEFSYRSAIVARSLCSGRTSRGSPWAVDDVRRIEPEFSIARWKVTAVYKKHEDAEHLFEGLRKVGLPEY
jgi:hypothetical protein